MPTPSFLEWSIKKLGPGWLVLDRVTAKAHERYANPIKRSVYEAAKREYDSLFGRIEFKSVGATRKR